MSQPQRQKTEEQIRHEIRQQLIGEAASAGQVVTIERGRLPYPKGLDERFGVTPAIWRALTDSVFPSAKTVEGIVLAVAYCKARNLDYMKRPVHVVPIWDSKKRREVESVWEGIGSLRTTAHRTQNYAGCDPCEFGPTIKSTFTAEVERNNQTRTETVEVEHPEWARMTVYRLVQGVRCAFPGPRVRWTAAYGRRGGTTLPNDMWLKRADEQLEKCAEAAALRRAFPEELGDVYAAEEMHGQVVDVTPEPTAEDRAARPQRGKPTPQDEDAQEAEVLKLTLVGNDNEEREFEDLDVFAEEFVSAMQALANAGDRTGLQAYWDRNSACFATLRQFQGVGTETVDGLTKAFREIEAALTQREAAARKAAQQPAAEEQPKSAERTQANPENRQPDPETSNAAASVNHEAKPQPWIFKPIGGRGKPEQLASAQDFAARMIKTIREQGYAPSPVSTFAFKLNEPGMKRLDQVEPELHAEVLQACRDAGCEV